MISLISSVQFSRSVVSDSLPPHESQHARPPCPSPFPGVHSNSRPLSQWCHPAISSSVVPFSSCPQSLPAWIFSNESTLPTRWPKYWSFSFSIIPSKEHPGLISFRMDWLDLLAVQGTFKSLVQHHSSKASILRHSAFFTFQLSHPYMTTGKTIAFTKRTFVGKVVSLLFNMLSRLSLILKFNPSTTTAPHHPQAPLLKTHTHSSKFLVKLNVSNFNSYSRYICLFIHGALSLGGHLCKLCSPFRNSHGLTGQ